MSLTTPDLEAVIRRALDRNQMEPDPDDVLRLYLELPALIPVDGEPREVSEIVEGAERTVVRLPRSFVRSSFEASYSDARSASNGGTSWIGAIGYLVFFDQLGGAVNRRSHFQQPTSSRDLERALEMFSDCSEAERAALYALRCCLAHDFSLANLAESVGPTRRHLYRHFFHLVPAHHLGQLVAFPDTAWAGDFGEVHATFVDLGFLEDLAATVHSRALHAHRSHDLELRISALEARHRFIFGHPEEIGINNR